jgi:hypothetical protein
MYSILERKPRTLALFAIAATLIAVVGCGSGSMNTVTTSGSSGAAFVVGTDAPLANVTSFKVQVMSVSAMTSGGTSVNLMSGTPTVDFARFNGLQTLLDLNDVPEGTYDSVTITLASTGSIGYLNTSGSVPAVATQAATISPTATTVTLANPLMVKASTAPVGLRVDFDLAKSIQVDGSGNITGAVVPNFDVSVVGVGDSGAYVDEFVAGIVSVNQTAQSFVIQGPHGENFTVNVNGQTEWDGDASLSTLAVGDIVQISGKLDKADQTFDADEVAILSSTNFYASGQITYVTLASGTATSFDLYVRGLEPTNTGLTLGQIAQINLTGNEKYFIYWMHNPFTNFFFNQSSLVAGQAVTVGGPASGASNPSAVTVNRIHLRNWGFNGTIVKGSENSATGSFQMQINGFAGVLIPETVTVYLGNDCDFRYGLGKFGDLADGAKVRVVGLLVKNPSGQVVLLGRHIDGFNFTDMATFAF